MPTIEELSSRVSAMGQTAPPGLKPPPSAVSSGKQTITFGDPGGDTAVEGMPPGLGGPSMLAPVPPMRPAGGIPIQPASPLSAAGTPRVTAAGAGMVRQNIATPPRITPNDGVRVDNGAGAPVSLSNPVVPTSTQPTGSIPMRPAGAVPGVNPNTQNPVPPQAPQQEEPAFNTNPKGKNKKGGKKSIFIYVGAGGLIFVFILLLIIAKGNAGPGNENVPTPTPEAPVEDFQEYEDPFGLGNGDEWIVDTFKYTEAELASLRRVGYTGTEIEDAQLLETPASELIEKAEQEREAYLNETLKPYYDGRSDEFKALENETWVGLPELDVNTIPSTPEEYDGILIKSVTMNTDYEKVTPRGNQLWLKIYIEKDKSDWVYYQCNYREWNALDDEGNVVVTFSITTLDTAEKYYESWKVDSITVY